jgi:hypothetical protein
VVVWWLQTVWTPVVQSFGFGLFAGSAEAIQIVLRDNVITIGWRPRACIPEQVRMVIRCSVTAVSGNVNKL